MPVEKFERFYYIVNVVFSRGAVQPFDILGVHGVEFLQIIVYLHQRGAYLGFGRKGGVAQHAYLGLGEIFVAQRNHIIDYSGEIGVERGFAIACKREHIGLRTVLQHILQLLLQYMRHFFSARAATVGATVGIEAAFAVNAVERTHFAIGGHEVYSQ